jgi:hypothetical protein
MSAKRARKRRGKAKEVKQKLERNKKKTLFWFSPKKVGSITPRLPNDQFPLPHSKYQHHEENENEKKKKDQ